MKIHRAILLSMFILMCAKAPDERILARAGGRIITGEEFVQRAEFSPEVRFRGPESARAGYLLDLLIDEKMAAQAAEEAGLDTATAVRQLTGFIKEMAAARELYRREVREQVRIDEAEIDRAVEYQAQTRRIGYLVFDDPALAEAYRQRLAEGTAFNAALQSLYGSAADTALNRREIRWGFNEAAIEEAAYALQPGQVSPVIRVEGACMVMVLEEITSHPVTTESEKARQRQLARRILHGRKEAAISDRFVAVLAAEKKLEFNKNLVRRVTEFLARASGNSQKDPGRSLPEDGPLAAESIADARRLLAGELEAPLVTWSDGTLSLRQMLEKWQQYNFSVDQADEAACRRAIVRGFSLIARDALLAGEAARRGCAGAAGVQKEVRMWRDHYLGLALQEQRENAVAGQFDWQPLLKEWRSRYPVQVDSMLLETIELNPAPMLALRPGQYNGRVAPPWIHFR
ncbi:MAG TPA: hypothetical protein PKJ13_00190 [bacterium]|nr:hypothetical protein [bacterium]